MIINDVIINRLILEQFLVLLPDQTPESVEILLNPSDPQDVPRAIELILAVSSLRFLDFTKFEPTQRDTFQALYIIGHLFQCLLHPFMTRELSLTQQIEYLSEFAHLSCALYRRHTTGYMSNQLYGDSQVMVKNVMFTVAKQQIRDPALPTFLILTGDDRLENLFGKVRMQGAHDANVDIKSLLHRLSAAMDIQSVYTTHPSWDPGHRRLQFNRLEHFDHLTPSAWTGDVISGRCDLKSAWEAGRYHAEGMLKCANIENDFTALFNLPGVDLMRPFLGGKYPGVADTPDRSKVLHNGSDAPTFQDEEDDNDNTANHAMEVDSELIQSVSGSVDLVNEGEQGGEPQDPFDEVNITLEDLMEQLHICKPDVPADYEQKKVSTDWLDLDGKSFHKASLIRCLFTSDLAQKCRERIFRIRGYTRDHMAQASATGDNTIGVHLFVLGDLYTGLIKVGSSVSLAVMKVTALEQKGKKVSSVASAEIGLPTADIFVTGQVLHLQTRAVMKTETDGDNDFNSMLLPTLSINADSPAEDTHQTSGPSTTEPPCLYWTGEYVKFKGLKSKADPTEGALEKTEKISRNSLIARMPGKLVCTIRGLLGNTLDLLPVEGKKLYARGLSTTWLFDTGTLLDLSETLWSSVKDAKLFSQIPNLGPSYSGQFPYGMFVIFLLVSR